MTFRVYYADTDAFGVVYYANYLRWLEAARTELLENTGKSVADHAAAGLVFTVTRIEVDYLAPAWLGDTVEVHTDVEQVRRVRFTLSHRITRLGDGAELVRARLTLACVDGRGKGQRLPEGLMEALESRIRER